MDLLGEWQPIVDRRHCSKSKWQEIRFDPTPGKEFRITFRKTPDVSECIIDELELLEIVDGGK